MLRKQLTLAFSKLLMLVFSFHNLPFDNTYTKHKPLTNLNVIKESNIDISQINLGLNSPNNSKKVSFFNFKYNILKIPRKMFFLSATFSQLPFSECFLHPNRCPFPSVICLDRRCPVWRNSAPKNNFSWWRRRWLCTFATFQSYSNRPNWAIWDSGQLHLSRISSKWKRCLCHNNWMPHIQFISGNKCYKSMII